MVPFSDSVASLYAHLPMLSRHGQPPTRPEHAFQSPLWAESDSRNTVVRSTPHMRVPAWLRGEFVGRRIYKGLYLSFSLVVAGLPHTAAVQYTTHDEVVHTTEYYSCTPYVRVLGTGMWIGRGGWPCSWGKGQGVVGPLIPLAGAIPVGLPGPIPRFWYFYARGCDAKSTPRLGDCWYYLPMRITYGRTMYYGVLPRTLVDYRGLSWYHFQTAKSKLA